MGICAPVVFAKLGPATVTTNSPTSSELILVFKILLHLYSSPGSNAASQPACASCSSHKLFIFPPINYLNQTPMIHPGSQWTKLQRQVIQSFCPSVKIDQND